VFEVHISLFKTSTKVRPQIKTHIPTKALNFHKFTQKPGFPRKLYHGPFQINQTEPNPTKVSLSTPKLY